MRENFRGTQNDRGHNFKGGYKIIIETTDLEEVELDLEKDNIQVILAGMIEAVVVGQDQV